MRSKDYWDIFMETGAPEAYLSYTKALKMEARDVSDNAGVGTQGHRLQ